MGPQWGRCPRPAAGPLHTTQHSHCAQTAPRAAGTSTHLPAAVNKYLANSSNTSLHLSKRGQKVPSKVIMRFPLQHCFISRPRSSTDFLPLPLNIRRQSRNPVMKIKRQRCVSLGLMRQIRHTLAWCPRTDRTVWAPGAEGTGEASALPGGHAHWDSALSLTGLGEGAVGGGWGGGGGSRAVTLGWEHILVEGTC